MDPPIALGTASLPFTVTRGNPHPTTPPVPGSTPNPGVVQPTEASKPSVDQKSSGSSEPSRGNTPPAPNPSASNAPLGQNPPAPPNEPGRNHPPPNLPEAITIPFLTIIPFPQPVPTPSVPGTNSAVSSIDSNPNLVLSNPNLNPSVPVNNPPIRNPPANNPPVNNLPVNNLPANNLPANNSPVNSLPVNNLPVNNPPPANNPPVNNLPANNPPANNLPANNPPVNNLPVNSLPVNNPPNTDPSINDPPLITDVPQVIPYNPFLIPLTTIDNTLINGNPSNPGTIIIGNPASPKLQQTITAGGPPAIISGTILSVAPQNGGLVISGTATVDPVTQVGGQTIWKDPSRPSVVLVGDGTHSFQTISANGGSTLIGSVPIALTVTAMGLPFQTPSPTMIQDILFSTLPDGTVVVGRNQVLNPGDTVMFEGRTIALDATGRSIYIDGIPHEAPSLLVTTIADISFSRLQDGDILAGGTTVLRPGGPGVMVQGENIMLGENGIDLVIDGKTHSLPALLKPATSTISGVPVEVIPGTGGASMVVVGGTHLLAPSDAPFVFENHSVSLALNGDGIIIDSTVYALPMQTPSSTSAAVLLAVGADHKTTTISLNGSPSRTNTKTGVEELASWVYVAASVAKAAAEMNSTTTAGTTSSSGEPFANSQSPMESATATKTSKSDAEKLQRGFLYSYCLFSMCSFVIGHFIEIM
ncbi:hypothetical protein GQ43DRAFT_219577 [Delitschia confertaspora ATCC 74209]|uniref:Uncharacterized protein n=1 Tax=Delitschia confertaspora ATCC 74209 TaxID=1513339 RepID=A0A9P4JD74_9PLEO|nr:hypothetical protein GQ43DRAFT_219577 [Delitschia confertaspora ATCC 74209]